MLCRAGRAVFEAAGAGGGTVGVSGSWTGGASVGAELGVVLGGLEVCLARVGSGALVFWIETMGLGALLTMTRLGAFFATMGLGTLLAALWSGGFLTSKSLVVEVILLFDG